MIATDKLLFLHLHKSGGTFVNALLLRCVPSAQKIGYHLPYREVPSELRHLPVVGTVRDPWGYYVSWYHFQSMQARPNILFQVCSNYRTLGLKQTITNLLVLSDDADRLAVLEQAMPESYEDVGLNLTKACVRDLRGHHGGFYSFLYHRLYQGAADPRIVKVERLREELRDVLQAVGHLPDPDVERFLVETPALNTSRHDEPRTYLDEELAGIVNHRERAVMAKHGYVL